MESNTDIVFSNDQIKATNMIDNFINCLEHKYFYLLGYAGTGKTFLISQVIRTFLETLHFNLLESIP